MERLIPHEYCKKKNVKDNKAKKYKAAVILFIFMFQEICPGCLAQSCHGNNRCCKANMNCVSCYFVSAWIPIHVKQAVQMYSFYAADESDRRQGCPKIPGTDKLNKPKQLFHKNGRTSKQTRPRIMRWNYDFIQVCKLKKSPPLQ